MMVLMVGLQPAENTHFLAKIQIPGFMQRFQDKQQLDLFFKFISHDILTPAELKFRFLPHQQKIFKPGLWYADGRTATWKSYVSMIQTTIPPSSELLQHFGLERSIAKKRELGSTKMEPSSSIQGTHEKQLKIQTNPLNNHSEEVVPIEERKWMIFLRIKYFKGNIFEAEVS